MKLRGRLEEAIYAAAFVQEFRARHVCGMGSWGESKSWTQGARIAAWEREVRMVAHETAEGYVEQHRLARRMK